nr:hypothetical protein Iba_chr10fCG10350 [Ipomoea batatas]
MPFHSLGLLFFPYSLLFLPLFFHIALEVWRLKSWKDKLKIKAQIVELGGKIDSRLDAQVVKLGGKIDSTLEGQVVELGGKMDSIL